MCRKYQLAFKIVPDEKAAKEFCTAVDKEATRYMRENNPAHYTAWNNPNEPGKFICWYYR